MFRKIRYIRKYAFIINISVLVSCLFMFQFNIINDITFLPQDDGPRNLFNVSDKSEKKVSAEDADRVLHHQVLKNELYRNSSKNHQPKIDKIKMIMDEIKENKILSSSDPKFYDVEKAEGLWIFSGSGIKSVSDPTGLNRKLRLLPDATGKDRILNQLMFTTDKQGKV